jgi:hypothetical protein
LAGLLQVRAQGEPKRGRHEYLGRSRLSRFGTLPCLPDEITDALQACLDADQETTPVGNVAYVVALLEPRAAAQIEYAWKTTRNFRGSIDVAQRSCPLAWPLLLVYHRTDDLAQRSCTIT